MNEQFEVGDKVRVAQSLMPRLYLTHQKKYAGRVGVVVRKFAPLGLGLKREIIVIKWGKRGNRGKEFEDKWTASDLELVA